MPTPTPTEERLDDLERENETLRAALASLERGVAMFKPMNLREPQHAALRAVVEGARRAPSTEPFVRPRHNHYAGGPRETWPRPETAVAEPLPETRHDRDEEAL